MTILRGEAARQHIVSATRELLLDGGLDAFNVEAVASVSGAARSTIYRHWPEPRDLLVEALTAMGRELDVPDTGSLHTDLVESLAQVRPILNDPRTRRLMLDVTRAAATDPEIERIRQTANRERRQPIQIILQRAIARGEIDPEIDLTLATHLIEGPLLSATVMQNRPVPDEDATELIDRIVKALS
ncbi:MAG: TetR/AcrR family transcriptional regulator [Acidimicrobiia bacterium]|jgi:AcrR family transcriptional regulator